MSPHSYCHVTHFPHSYCQIKNVPHRYCQITNVPHRYCHTVMGHDSWQTFSPQLQLGHTFLPAATATHFHSAAIVWLLMSPTETVTWHIPPPKHPPGQISSHSHLQVTYPLHNIALQVTSQDSLPQVKLGNTLNLRLLGVCFWHK